MLPRSKTLPQFIFGAELRKMLKLKGRKLAPLESNIIYNNMRLEFSKRCSHTRWYFLNAFFQKVKGPFNLF